MEIFSQRFTFKNHATSSFLMAFLAQNMSKIKKVQIGEIWKYFRKDLHLKITQPRLFMAL